MSMTEIATVPVRVWDLPTRAFHWALALAVAGSVVSAKIGGGAMVWHFRFGYLVLTLLAFRVLWGLVGGRWSRFASFVYAPATLLRYLRGRFTSQDGLDVGHSPTGALSVFALLGILLVQLGTGLVADDEIANLGPLNRLVSTETALTATSWHKSWGQWLLLGLVALHILAIVYYLMGKRINLVRPMLRGDKPLPPGTPASADGLPQRALALLLLALCAALATWVARQG
ncbi:MAG: cytochrome b/b6 domain-containing protein [Rubrivivax sp.]|nr:cytochrome b/b6 domain-containing protein [Rubrivivax sp.]